MEVLVSISSLHKLLYPLTTLLYFRLQKEQKAFAMELLLAAILSLLMKLFISSWTELKRIGVVSLGICDIDDD